MTCTIQKYLSWNDYGTLRGNLSIHRSKDDCLNPAFLKCIHSLKKMYFVSNSRRNSYITQSHALPATINPLLAFFKDLPVAMILIMITVYVFKRNGNNIFLKDICIAYICFHWKYTFVWNLYLLYFWGLAALRTRFWEMPWKSPSGGRCLLVWIGSIE